MGVDRTDYLMLAADMGANAFNWDHHAPEMEGQPNRRFDIIYDGMCGKYCLAGKVIAQSDPYEGFEMATINPNNLAIDRTALAEAVSLAFDRKITREDFKLILFSHFS